MWNRIKITISRGPLRVVIRDLQIACNRISCCQ